MSTVERVAACACGKVRLSARGTPIVNGACHCSDCQAGARLMEGAGARPGFCDAWGGTAYLSYRDDRLDWLEGREMVRGFKLKPDAPTTRYMTTCCNTAIFLKYGPGWWTSVYRGRFGDRAPPLEMRNKTAHAISPETLPRDVPAYRNFPMRMVWRLLSARVAMWLHI
jgi:hypothetical protein